MMFRFFLRGRLEVQRYRFSNVLYDLMEGITLSLASFKLWCVWVAAMFVLLSNNADFVRHVCIVEWQADSCPYGRKMVG
jgi:hypothetical protein